MIRTIDSEIVLAHFFATTKEEIITIPQLVKIKHNLTLEDPKVYIDVSINDLLHSVEYNPHLFKWDNTLRIIRKAKGAMINLKGFHCRIHSSIREDAVKSLDKVIQNIISKESI